MQSPSAEQYLPAPQVWERLRRNLTLWRWLKDADLKFPQPSSLAHAFCNNKEQRYDENPN